MLQQIKNLIDNLLVDWGVALNIIIYLRVLILLVVMVLIAYIAFWITKKIIINYIYKLFRRTPMKWDDIFADHKTFDSVAHIVPAMIVKVVAPVLFSDFSKFLPFVLKITNSYLVIVGLMLVLSFLKVIEFGL